ncbi:hypothetical protein HC864_04905 [Candidatus Gracilibacteria bacterium]|nr:hypothetical protein [Candidatus Gracilibacteria bacterium]
MAKRKSVMIGLFLAVYLLNSGDFLFLRFLLMQIEKLCKPVDLHEAKRSFVEKNLQLIENFVYTDVYGNTLENWNAFGPIAELMIWKQRYELEKVKQGLRWMQKTFALLLSYSPNGEQIDLTFTPTADACFHAFCKSIHFGNNLKNT